MTSFEEIVSHLDAKQDVPTRMRAIFGLKSLKTSSSIKALEKSLLTDPSALIRHEVAYVLGQMKAIDSIPTLRQVLSSREEDVMVRHEAGEALGAIGESSSLDILQKYAKDCTLPREITETCALACVRIRLRCDDQRDGFGTIDPMVPDGTDEKMGIDELRRILCNVDENIVDRYKALFTLRNRNTDDCVKVLCDCLCNVEEHSNLLKHEIAYVLGQMKNALAVDSLGVILKRGDEKEMVRHEAAEALGAIATEDAEEILKLFEKDDADVVRESVHVALDIKDYVSSDGCVHYADTMKSFTN